MSNQLHSERKIILAVAVIAIIIIVFIFLINKTAVWRVNDNHFSVTENSYQNDINIIPIKNRQEIVDIFDKLKNDEKNENLDLDQAINLMDKLVENSNKFFIVKLDYKKLGVESKEFETSLERYYNSIVKSINVLNSTEWQKISNDKFVIAATVQNSKNKMFFDEFYTTLNNLDKVFEEMDKLVVVDLDKPFQCGLPDTRAVYLCENEYYKITNYSGFIFYDDNGQKVDNCECNQLKCFEDNNLCD